MRVGRKGLDGGRDRTAEFLILIKKGWVFNLFYYVLF